MISVLIPAYNEKARLPPTLAEIERFCMENEYVTEVLIVDDGSRDQTVERAMYYSSRIPGFKILRHNENKGKWAAISTGIENAKNDRILLMDADGSADIWQLKRLYQIHGAIIFTDDEAYYGSRFMKRSRLEEKSLFRRFISQGYRWYVSFWYWLATGRRDVDDMQCPFKLFSRSKMLFSLTTQRYSGDVELSSSLNQPIVNVPVRFIHKRGSKVPVSSVFAMAIDTVKVALECRKRLKGVQSKCNTDIHNVGPHDNKPY